jgi:stage V sporulation protein G
LKGPFPSAKMCRQRLDGSREVPRVKITKVEIRPMRNEGNLKAFCSVVFDHVFIVHSVKIIQGRENLFVAMPSREGKNGEFRDTAHPIDNEFRLELEETVLERYREVVGEMSEVLVGDIPTEDVTF